MINNKTILITGGTGSFGQNFAQFLLKKFKLKKIIIYSRDEQKQFTMKNKLQKYGDRLRFFIRINFKINVSFSMFYICNNYSSMS